MGGPAKPPDSSLVPWSEAAVVGDKPLTAIWYTSIVRAINRRLNAINAIPLAEDTSHYWFPASDDVGSSNPTEWGQPALTCGSLNLPRYIYNGGNYWLDAPLISVGEPPSLIGWRPTKTYKVVSSTSTNITGAIPISTNEEDPSNPIQYPADGYSGPINSDLQAASWTPAAGDHIKTREEAPPVSDPPLGEGLGSPTVFAYPDDFGLFHPRQLYFGYPQLMAMVINLLAYFIDPSINWAGKIESDVQNLCQAHQDWYDHLPLISSLGSVYPGGKAFYSLNIRPLFQTAYPAWPPKTAPVGWPGAGPFGGFTRIREREITTISDPGADGQVARFILSYNGQYEDGQYNFSTDDLSQFYGPAWNVPARPHPFTPEAEFKYSRKVMLHTGGDWTVHPNQSTPVDRLTFYGLPKPGDIFGTWIINELRAAISLLTDWIADEHIWYGFSVSSTDVISGDKSAAYGADSSSYGHAASSAAAVSAYGNAPNPQYGPDPTGLSLGLNGVYSLTASDQDVSGPGYYCASNAAKLYAFSYAHGQTRDVKFWMISTLPPTAQLSSYTFDNAGLSWATFSTYPSADGASTDFGQICLAGTASASVADHIDLAGYLGSLPAWLPASFPATPALGAHANVRGVGLVPLVCTMHCAFTD